MKITTFVLILSVAASVYAGEKTLSGNLQWDLTGIGRDTILSNEFNFAQHPNMKNPFYSGLFSLAIPGAGQYHSERYTKAAIFFAAEVALIAYVVINNNNGDKKTEEFQRYADQHWSAVRYAQWINTYGVTDYGPATNIDLNRVANKDFSEINEWESNPSPNKIGFSHQLPSYGEQQYYELIGKYHQFKYGWDTYPRDAQGIPISDNRNYDGMIPQQMIDYSKERGRANDYYHAAGFAASAIVINHVVSAFDAYLSTKNYNKEISASFGVKPLHQLEGKGMMSELRISIGL